VTVERRSVRVRDHGPGLGRADPARLFDRFYRGPQSHGTPGSGLGLAIVKQAVERHGGRVHADDAPDGGAVVGFELPARADS
jgi:two-component system sensor histidine kinase MprB